MKLNINYIYIITISLCLSISCSKEELIKYPTEAASLEQIKEGTKVNKDLQAFNIAGVYSLMLKKGTGGTTGNDDFGQKGYDIYSDMLSGDMVLAATIYGWYSNLANLNSTKDFTSLINYRPWRYYYRIIFAVNGVIDALGGNDVKDLDDVGKQYMGQAKAMRSYAYLYLINFFSKDFNLNEKILPLYLTTADANLAQVENQKVLDQMVKDLTEAVSYLDSYERPSMSYVNKYVAEGLLAYVYVTMGYYDKARDVAKDVIDNSGFVLSSKTDVTGGFNNVNTPGWMWGSDLTTQTGLDLISWWGQVDIYTYSYAFVGDYKAIDESLYTKIKANDIRKSQFGKVNDFELVPINKFYDANKKIGGQRIITSDYVYMRDGVGIPCGHSHTIEPRLRTK